VRTALRVDIRGEQMPVASLEDIIGPRKPPADRKTSRPFLHCKNGSSAQQGSSSEEQAAAMAAGPRNVRLLIEPVNRLTRHSARSQP